MEIIKLTEKQKHLIEKFGVALEKSHMSPAQARIAALLIISDKVDLTFDEIKDTLQLSKSATSNGINALLLMNKISYSTKLGDRKRYFKSKLRVMEGEFEEKINQLLEFKILLQEIVHIRTKETPEFNNDIHRVIEFMDFIQSELPDIYMKWKKLQAK